MKHPGGRPKAKIDWDEIAKMASIHCTQEEIAFISGVTVDTLDTAAKREHGVSFSEFCSKKRAFGKASLRRSMWRRAIDGDSDTLMIWLSKNHLGMTDKQEADVKVTTTEKVFVAEWGGKAEEPDVEK